MVCSSRHFAKDGCNTAQGDESDVVDVSIVPEAAWREAQRRAEVIRPLLENDHRPRHLVRAAAATLGLLERQTYTLPRRCRDAGGAVLVAHDQGTSHRAPAMSRYCLYVLAGSSLLAQLLVLAPANAQPPINVLSFAGPSRSGPFSPTAPITLTQGQDF